MERVKGMEERWWWMMDQCITRSKSESSEHASFCAAHACSDSRGAVTCADKTKLALAVPPLHQAGEEEA